VLAHFCRSFNDRLDGRRQELIAYIPRLANTLDTEEVVRSRLQLLATEFQAVGGSPDFAERLKARFARARLPAHASSFALEVLCDAVTLKRSASHAFTVLDRLLSMGAPSQGFSTNLSERARDLETVLTS
jgi:hypothetical protein